MQVNKSKIKVTKLVKIVLIVVMLLLYGSPLAEGKMVGEQQLINMIKAEIELQEQRVITATYEDQVFEITRGRLGLAPVDEWDEIIAEMKAFAMIYQDASSYELVFQYDDKKVADWIRSISKSVNQAKVEPSIVMNDAGVLEQVPGKSGYRVLEAKLYMGIQATLLEHEDNTSSVSIFVEEIFPEREVALLEAVDTLIASFSTSFAFYGGEERAENVKLGAQKINQVLLMPGDEFSFLEQVTPITKAAGYKEGIVFINNKAVLGIGGGICQVTSTLYNAALKAGIVATERRGHSLIVDYVPRGQDATMAENLIDYRFVNTLDYPLYIHTYTENDILTIELWSNSEALGGITYEAKSTYVGLTKDGRLMYDTTLYGYDANNKVVFEQFLHRSTYREE